jgi:hypothetical protein
VDSIIPTVRGVQITFADKGLHSILSTERYGSVDSIIHTVCCVEIKSGDCGQHSTVSTFDIKNQFKYVNFVQVK